MRRDWKSVSALLSALTLATACQTSQRPKTPGDRNVASVPAEARNKGLFMATLARPTALDVHKLLTSQYGRPARHTVTERALPLGEINENLIRWSRSYDGIEILQEARSVRFDGINWETRHMRELAEPEPARLDQVISAGDAIARSGLKQPTTRLVYRPEFAKTALPGAMDLENVVSRYRLAMEVATEAAVVWLDAYDGKLLDRWESRTHLTAIYGGSLYPSVTLDVTPGLPPPPQPDDGPIISPAVDTPDNILQDPIRFTLVNADGSPLNGQGILTAPPNSVTNGITPMSFELAGETQADRPALIDAAHALRESWDFYKTVFNRTGLRNLGQSSGPSDNPNRLYNTAVITLDPTDASINAGMDFDKTLGLANGKIVINSGNLMFWTVTVSVEILGHEYSHAVFENETKIIPQQSGETSGLNEGTADYFGALIRKRAQAVRGGASNAGIVELSDPNDWVSGLEQPDYKQHADIRYMCKPSKGGVLGIDFVDAKNFSQLDGHLSLGPIERVLCLLTRGAAASGRSNGDPDLVTSLPDGFVGLGSPAVANMWYRALGFLSAHSSPDYDDARTELLRSTAMQFGTQTCAAYRDVQDAFAEVHEGDPAPPDITLESSTYIPGQGFDLNVVDGVTSVTATFDGVAVPVTGPPWQVLIPDGAPRMDPHTLTITTIDAFGNRRVVSYTIQPPPDPDPPLVTFTDITEAQQLPKYGRQRRFSFFASDSGTGIVSTAVLVDDAAQFPYVTTYPSPSPFVQLDLGSLNLQDQANGSHVISLKVTDAAGNVGTATLPPFFRERTPPICVFALDHHPTDTLKAVVAPAALDYGSGVDSISVAVDAPTPPAGGHLDPAHVINANTALRKPPGFGYTNVFFTNELASGPHTFLVECGDQQGNFTLSAPQSITLQPPCGPANCANGCCINKQCINPTAHACGINGVACVDCGSGGCSQGFCVSPTLPSCNTREIAGENVNDDTTFNMGRSSGFVQLAYQTFDIPDQVYVTTPGSNIHIADTGCVSTGDFFNYLSFSYSGTSSLTVHVVHNCDGSSDNTRWSYVLTCP